MKSPPARGRGLKPSNLEQERVHDLSPPARGRGLKLKDIGDKEQAVVVAPRAGAWIET